MKQMMRSAPFFIAVLLVLFPFNGASALIVNSPHVVDRGENHREKVVEFSVLTFELPATQSNLNSTLDSSLNNLPVTESEISLGVQAFFPPWMYLNTRGIINELAPTPIPTSVLLLGTSLIGLIGIARRSFLPANLK